MGMDPVQTRQKHGNSTVRGRVGDDITQGKDDEGSVRNCRNLYIFEFLK